MKRMVSHPFVRGAVLVYVALLHVVVGVALLKTNVLLLAGRKLGIVPGQEMTAEFVAVIVEQARRDASVTGAATVLIGDSLAEALDATRIAGDAVNYGIGGDTVRTLLYRLPVLRSVERARAVVVNIGVNDLSRRTVATIGADYQTLLSRLPSSAPVVAISVLPVDETVGEIRRHAYLRNANMRSLNAAIRPICEKRPNCRFLDVWPALADGASGGLRPYLHNGDGLHLSPAGNRALEGLIRAELAATGPAGRRSGSAPLLGRREVQNWK
jgi:lysophospholipase L1-like esterase